MMRLALIIFTLLLALSYTSLKAQSADDLRPGQLAKVETKSESYIGEIIESKLDEVIIKTLDGIVVKIPKTSITSAMKLRSDQVVNGEYMFDNPFYSRNYVTETAFTPKKGTGFYQNVMLGVHSFGYGITDNVSLTAGFESFTILNGNTPLFYIQPKVRLTPVNDPVQFALGTNLILIPDGSERNIFGSFFGIVSVGSKNHNLSIGAGWGFTSDDISNTPIIQLGGQTRLGRGVSLVTDNVFIVSDNSATPLGSLVIRILRPKISIDIGAGFGGGGGAPLVGINIPFGK